MARLAYNIMKGVLSATETEIVEGMNFYYGANGLCRFVAKMFGATVEQTAGVYAVLSPMNGWETNVANMIDVFRYRDEAHINNTPINRSKALRIVNGEDPLSVIRGTKVTSFYQAIANPLNIDPVPVDRHLISLALGRKVASCSRDMYRRIEATYKELGDKERIGNRLASIVWFVQRRLTANQETLDVSTSDSSYVCCNKIRHSHGRTRLRCAECRSTILRSAYRQHRPMYDGRSVSIDSRGRKRIHLPKDDPRANSGGWQYLSRYIVMKQLNRVLHKDEHVHHKDHQKDHDDLHNFQVLLAESHGRHHVYIAELCGGRGSDGRFIEYDEPISLRSRTTTGKD